MNSIAKAMIELKEKLKHNYPVNSIEITAEIQETISNEFRRFSEYNGDVDRQRFDADFIIALNQLEKAGYKV
jgi:hypothetical protein